MIDYEPRAWTIRGNSISQSNGVARCEVKFDSAASALTVTVFINSERIRPQQTVLLDVSPRLHSYGLWFALMWITEYSSKEGEFDGSKTQNLQALMNDLWAAYFTFKRIELGNLLMTVTKD